MPSYSLIWFLLTPSLFPNLTPWFHCPLFIPIAWPTFFFFKLERKSFKWVKFGSWELNYPGIFFVITVQCLRDNHFPFCLFVLTGPDATLVWRWAVVKSIMSQLLPLSKRTRGPRREVALSPCYLTAVFALLCLNHTHTFTHLRVLCILAHMWMCLYTCIGKSYGSFTW